MALATFSLQAEKDRVDREKGVVYGVRLAEVGKVARFKADDGKTRATVITKEHTQSFINHAGNRAIPVHWTHDYLDEPKKDKLHSSVGALKNFRMDEGGNAIADFYVAPTNHKEAIFWAAEVAPENMVLSAVFSFDPNDPKVMPQNLKAADLVEFGAATTALFAEAETKPMTKEEIESIVAESIAKWAEANKPKDNKDEAQAALAAAVKEAEDRVTASFKAELESLKASVKDEAKAVAEAELVTAEARFTAALGKSGASFKPEAKASQAPTKTRAEFARLSSAEQDNFILNQKGKIQD